MSELKWISTARKLIGTTEIVGSKHNPVIVNMWKEAFTKTGQAGRLKEYVWKNDETAWCLTGDIEVLTDRGFIRFDELKDLKDTGIQVAYVDTNNNHTVKYTDEFVFITKYNHEKILYSDKYGIGCDDRHRFYGKVSTNGKYQLREVKDLTTYGINVPFIRSGSLDGLNISNDELVLLAGVLSDGHMRENELRSELRSEYLSGYKTLTKEFVYGLSEEQAKVFIHAYGQFDGHTKGNNIELYSADEQLAKDLNVIASLAGYRSTQFKIKQVSANTKIEYLYHVIVNTRKKHRNISLDNFVERDFNGELYCLTVPSSVFVIRTSKGIIMPIGNCGGFVAYVLAQYDDLIKHIPKSFPLARSWANAGTKLKRPAYGSIAVFARGAGGHVGFVVGEDSKGNLLILGGNQGNKVSIVPISKSRLLCCVWCGTQPLPSEQRYNLPKVTHNMKTSKNEA